MTGGDLLDWARDHAHRRDPETSVQAAVYARDFANGHCGIIHQALRQHREGLTSLELSELTGLAYHEVARRVADLKHGGLAVDSGARRRNPSGRQAAVWRAQLEVQ